MPPSNSSLAASRKTEATRLDPLASISWPLHIPCSAQRRAVPARSWTLKTGYLPRRAANVELHIKYERGVGNRAAPAEVKFYSAKNPSFYQISRQEQVLDILRNATTNPPDRVKEFSFKASGGSYAKLFDGTEKVLSWDNIVWINRSVLMP